MQLGNLSFAPHRFRTGHSHCPCTHGPAASRQLKSWEPYCPGPRIRHQEKARFQPTGPQGFSFRWLLNDGNLERPGSPPWFSTVRIRWLEKCPVLLGFSPVAKSWRRGRDSHPANRIYRKGQKNKAFHKHRRRAVYYPRVPPFCSRGNRASESAPQIRSPGGSVEIAEVCYRKRPHHSLRGRERRGFRETQSPGKGWSTVTNPRTSDVRFRKPFHSLGNQ